MSRSSKKIIPFSENKKVYRKLPELVTFQSLIEEAKFSENGWAPTDVRTIATVSGRGVEFPIQLISFGAEAPEAPCLFLVGGIHGLERIGSQVVLTCLDALIDRLKWDVSTQEMLSHIRVVFVPIMNPIGIYHGIRSNARGVDLMRNAPVEAEGDSIIGIRGHRFSARFPYFRGELDSEMEPEVVALAREVERHCFASRAVICMDFHSGFGTMDQIWFPYARSREPFPDLAAIHSLKSHFDESFPAHGYLIEPQALNYTTHGDLWDYLYTESRKKEGNCFLPLTLEMGSWYWILKNPFQIFSRHGLFNPLNHRVHDEVLRNHLVLFDFLLKAVHSHKMWSEMSPSKKQMHENYAKEIWHGK